VLEVTGGLGFIDFDKVSYTKTLDRVLGQIIREAARQWLKAVLTSVPERGGFPVLTGAAKSTLVPLGRVLRVAVPVRPVPAKGRNVVVDRRADGIQSQQFTLTSKNFEYEFSWSTDLLHYYLNETFPMLQVKYTPWESVKQGNAAFITFLEAAIQRRLPNVADYIEIRRPS
jgi:hypothetical protein